MSPRRAFPIRFLWTTWVVGVLGVGLAVLVNWPLPYCELRVGTPDAEVDGTSGGSGYVTTVHGSRYAGVPWRFYERVSDTWLLERWHAPGPETRWYPRRLVGNILLAALLIVFAMSYWQMRSRRARRLLQITLSDIVIAMLAIGMGFGGWRILQDRQQHQLRLYHAGDVLGHETTVRLPESVSDWLDSKHVTCLTTCTWLSVKEPTSDRLRELGTLHDLELLKIRDGSYAAEDLAVLSRLPRLRMLGLSGTPAARGFLDQRSTLTNLHALHLHEVPLTDQDLALLKPLQGLTLLRLEDTAITDAGFQHLAALRGLKRLRVLSSRLDGSGIQALSGHPRLESFQFWEPQFFGSSIALPGCSFPSVQLSDMPELRSVQIMADVARSELHELPQLRTAVIAPTSAAYNVSILTSAEVSLAGLPAIQRLLLDGPNLRRLDLDRLDTLNRLSLDYTEPAFAPREDSVERRKRRYVVSAETLAAIAESKSLFSLRMANAAVDNAQLALLAKLPNLRELYLRGSNLDDEGLEHLGRMPRLQELDVRDTRVTVHAIRNLQAVRPALEIVSDRF